MSEPTENTLLEMEHQIVLAGEDVVMLMALQRDGDTNALGDALTDWSADRVKFALLVAVATLQEMADRNGVSDD